MAMSLLINILGGPALNSRLNLSVREKYGLAYSVEASYNTFADTGFWQIYVGSEAKNMNKAIDLIYKELQVFQTKELSSLQLQRAKAQLKGHLALGMDSNAGLMQGLGKSLLAFNQIDTLAENVKLIVNNPKIQTEQKILKQFLLKKKELENGFKKSFDENSNEYIEQLQNSIKEREGQIMEADNEIKRLQNEVGILKPQQSKFRDLTYDEIWCNSKQLTSKSSRTFKLFGIPIFSIDNK
jgi:hypothetical protein